MSTAQTIDLDARYSVNGYGGIAFYIIGPAMDETEEEAQLICDDNECDHTLSEMCWIWSEAELVESDQFVRAVMVGDDQERIVDVDDLTVISEEDYCSSCGQIGCTADGR